MLRKRIVVWVIIFLTLFKGITPNLGKNNLTKNNEKCRFYK